jgi:hypothetical protein
VVQEAVEDRGGDGGVFEDLAPAGDAAVGGEDDRADCRWRELVASGMPDWLVQHLDGAFARLRAGPGHVVAAKIVGHDGVVGSDPGWLQRVTPGPLRRLNTRLTNAIARC